MSFIWEEYIYEHPEAFEPALAPVGKWHSVSRKSGSGVLVESRRRSSSNTGSRQSISFVILRRHSSRQNIFGDSHIRIRIGTQPGSNSQVELAILKTTELVGLLPTQRCSSSAITVFVFYLLLLLLLSVSVANHQPTAATLRNFIH